MSKVVSMTLQAVDRIQNIFLKKEEEKRRMRPGRRKVGHCVENNVIESVTQQAGQDKNFFYVGAAFMVLHGHA